MQSEITHYIKDEVPNKRLLSYEPSVLYFVDAKNDFYLKKTHPFAEEVNYYIL